MQLSVMPKGVEHTFGLMATPEPTNVQLSVMPKGVEHQRLGGIGSDLAVECNYQ